MPENPSQDELKDVNEDSVPAAAVGYGILGVVLGSVIGAGIVTGVFYLVRILQY